MMWRIILLLYRCSHRSARSGAPWVKNLVISASKKFWLWGNDVPPPLHVRRHEILHFKHPRVSAVNRIASRTFRDKNNNNKADSFFRLNFNVYIDLDKRERARARDKKQKRPISLEEKLENFIAAVGKRGNASGHQGEISGSEKKKWTGTHKTCN